VVGVFAGEQGGVLDEHGHRLQDEGTEQLDVNVIPGAMQPPVYKPPETQTHRINIYV